MENYMKNKSIKIRQVVRRLKKQFGCHVINLELVDTDIYDPETDEFILCDYSLYLSYANGLEDNLDILNGRVLHGGKWYPLTEDGWNEVIVEIRKRSIQGQR
jgi:hypothetical protein